METCGGLQDLFSTYVALSDWIKALWLVTPPVSVLGLAWILVNRPRG